MAEALPDSELSRLEVRDDDEVCLMLRKMPYEELTGKRGGVFYHTQDDGHLYRFNKPIKNDPNKIGVYCNHIKITKDATVKEKCKACGVIDPVSNLSNCTSFGVLHPVDTSRRLPWIQRKLDRASLVGFLEPYLPL